MTIRNDATRQRVITTDPRRARSVVSRQGQVLLDTDFDQQSRHLLERIEVETLDVLGSPQRLVYPAGTDGFKITLSGGAPVDFSIAAGRGYLKGWLVENAATCKLGTQPHPRAGDTLASPGIVALKALIRHIDPVEDPVLADKALGDAQASGRALVDWQVFPFSISAAVTCATSTTNADWLKLTAPSTGTLAVIPQAAAPSTDPCSLTPGGGYTRLENLLYRIEVHEGVAQPGFPTADGPRFRLDQLKVKLSRRNASVMAKITTVASSEISVAPPALDARNWFAPGLYAEIVSPHDDVDPRPALAAQRLFRIASATDDKVTLEATPAQIVATGATGAGAWFLRLWDAFPGGAGVATVAAPGGSSTSAVIDLGDGLSIQLGGGAGATFRRGDHWTCAARADGSVDWPAGAVQMTPHGPETRYAPLAVLGGPATAPTLEDCRIPFATLTDRALLYRGGDGQSLFPPAAGGIVDLPAKLRVAVMRGETPVAGAEVQWSLPAGSPTCQINGVVCGGGSSPVVVTDGNGLAEVKWSIDAAQNLAVHHVQAALLNGAVTGQPPLLFTATFNNAVLTGYKPGVCAALAGVDNVQDALDALCAKLGDDERPTLTLEVIELQGSASARIELIEEGLILNALEVPFNSFMKGIFFGIREGKPDIDIEDFDPVVEVEVDLPYPITDPERLYWAMASRPSGKPAEITGPFGFQKVRLDGSVVVVDGKKKKGRSGLMWEPSDQARNFLHSTPQHLWGQTITPPFAMQLQGLGWKGQPSARRLLCRLRLRSALIWMDDAKTKERVYLNAEHLGIRGPRTRRELQVRERDPQRAADLDMFFYLMPG